MEGFNKEALKQCLPLSLDLGDAVGRVGIVTWHEGLLDRTVALVGEAARRGDNVGVDEFPTESHVRRLLQASIGLAVVGPRGPAGRSGAVHAVVVISPSDEERGFQNFAANVRLFVSGALSLGTCDPLARLLALAEAAALAAPLDYRACYLSVAVGCPRWLAAARGRGYMPVAHIPSTINLQGRGLCASIILYKMLLTSTKHFRQPPESLACDVIARCSLSEEQYMAVPLPVIHTLPFPLAATCGLRLSLRNVRRDDDVILYRLFREAADQGQGFAQDEMPSLGYMRAQIVKDHVVMVEEARSEVVVGACVFRSAESFLCRHSGGTQCDASTVVRQDYRGRGIGSDIMNNMYGLFAEMGYTLFVSDILMTNEPFLETTVAQGNHVAGFFPCSAFVRGAGWTDSVITWRHVTCGANGQTPPVAGNSHL